MHTVNISAPVKAIVSAFLLFFLFALLFFTHPIYAAESDILAALSVSSGDSLKNYINNISQTSTSNFLRVSGTQIIDSNGNPFQLKGIGMGNNVWYSQSQLPLTDHDEESFAELEALGFNSVRFYLNASLFESDSSPYAYNESAFEWLDNNIKWAKKHNIRLLLNMHIPQGGKIKPSNTVFWDNSDYQNRFIALWTEIARRYEHEDTILGYGLLNEPFVPKCDTSEESLDLYYNLIEKTAASIREVDTNHMLFIERPYGIINSEKNIKQYIWGYTESFRIIPDNNTVYEFHFYERTEFTHQGLSWLSYNDKWIYNTDNIAFLSGERQLGKICKSSVSSVDFHSSTWQHVESAPINITNPDANYGYWWVYLYNMGSNSDLYIDNIVINEYDANGVYLRDLQTYDFSKDPHFAGWDLGSGGGGKITYNATSGVHNDGCAQVSNALSSYRFFNNYGNLNLTFPISPEHTYTISADICLCNVSTDFSLEFGIQTGTCENVYGFDKEYLRHCLKQFLDFGDQNNVPLYLGEFGVARPVMNEEYQGDAWVEDMFDLLNEYNLGYSYHDYHEESFGLYINDSRQPRGAINQVLYDIFSKKIP